MRRLSRRFGARRLIAVAAAGALLLAMPGAATASAADGTPSAMAGPPATSVALSPCGIKYAAGSLYIGAGDAVYKVSEGTGRATSIAPGRLSPVSYEDPQACGVAVDGAGNVIVANGPDVVVVAAKTGTFYGRRMTAGRVYSVVFGFLAVTGAVDVQLDRSGNLVIAVGGSRASHTDNESDSQIFVLAERAGAFYGKKMAKGKLYLIAGVLNGGAVPPCYGPDATAAAGAAATLDAADTTDPATKAIQANLGYTIGSLRFDAAGNIILADSAGDGTGACGASWDIPPRVAVIPARTGAYYGRKMTVGDIYAIAGLGATTGNGAPAVDSGLTGVTGVAVDHAGNVLVAATSRADPLGGVRVIAARTGTFYGQQMRQGDIYALPGLAWADTVAVDNAGNVLVGENNYLRVQMLAVKTGAYYGVKARAGRVYTIAGNGKPPL
jgi:hypothetical protein